MTSQLIEESGEFYQTVIAKIDAAFPEAVLETIFFLGELTVVVDRASVVDVCTYLRNGTGLVFNVMCDLSAVDLWPGHPRFEVNVHLLALPLRPYPEAGMRRLRIKVRLDEHDAKMPSLTDVWPAAAWYERETHDLFGIVFEGNPDLRPLLLPEDWEGTPPLRRDVPVYVEEIAFSFNQERIYRGKPFAKE
jgi:NADH-quinone oxidoreductase subunit C